MEKLHPRAVWLFFIRFVLTWLIGILIFGIYIAFILADLDNTNVPSPGFLRWLWIIVPLLLIFFWMWAKLTYRFYLYELREDGFRKELGVIWKKYVTIPYDRIQNVDIYRGVVDRILGLSDLNIQTAGISAQISRYGARGLGAEGVLPGLSQEVAEQLRDELVRRARQYKNQGL